MSDIELTQPQLDALREISLMAVGNASTTLSVMLGKKVNVTVPKIMVVALEKVPGVLGRTGEIVNVVYFSVSGQISGSIFMIFSVSESLKLADILIGKKVGQTKSLDEIKLSALKEMGNMIAGSYVRVLADVLKARIMYSVPGFASDMLGAVLDGILARLSLKAEYAVISESKFTVEEFACKVHFIFIPEPETLELMIKASGEMSGKDGGEREQAVPGINNDQELMDVFYKETQDLIDEMKKALPLLKNELPITDYQPRIKALFRCAHTIRSSSGMVGFDDLKEITKTLEGIFKAGRDGIFKLKPDIIDLLLEGVCVCQKLLRKKIAVNYKEVLENLRKVLTKRA